MNEKTWQSIIEQIHASGRRIVIAVTGGGSGCTGVLLQVPGGSQSVLESLVPYDLRALHQFLGFEPAQACSSETAVAMARRSYERARDLLQAETDRQVVGIGATASLVSDRPKRGSHRCHIAAAVNHDVSLATIELCKGARSRPAEEELVSQAIIAVLAAACGVTAPSLESLLAAGDRFEHCFIASADPISRLVRGEISRVTVMPDGELRLGAPSPINVLPGSFDPLHDGHLGLAEAATEILQAPVAFEISILNVDKPPLADSTVRRRLEQFSWRSRVELTRAATFLEKAELFPGATFVVGADTAERIVAPQYYGGHDTTMLDALDRISRHRGHFLVAVRADSSGHVQSLADLAIPEQYRGLFHPIPESRYRVDVSSTALRNEKLK